MPELLSPVGPLFGPNFVVVTVKNAGESQDTKGDEQETYAVQVFPDALNPSLKAAGLPTQYYFQPARVYLARRQDSNRYAFGMFIYKGLMSSESSVGVPPGERDLESAGGWCTFTTTFAIPDWAIEATRKQIKQHEYVADDKTVDEGVVEKYFNWEQGGDMPEPRLGPIPVLASATTLEVPQIAGEPEARGTLKLYAQGAGKGSIESHGYNTFHVTCNEIAAGAIAGSIKGGKSAFTVHNELQEQFYATETTIKIDVDVDKVQTTFSAAVSAGGFLGIDTLSASFAFEQCLTNGGVTTTIVKGDVSEKMQDWINQQAQDMRSSVINLVKSEIFDWKPPSPTEATASNDRGWFSNLFGGAIVSLKGGYAKKGIKYSDTLSIVGPMTRTHTVSGDLSDLALEFKADPDAYLTVADIGEYFRKLQVAATCNIFAREKMPVSSVKLVAKYPDFNVPEINGEPNFDTKDSGEHHALGAASKDRWSDVARWTADNPDDVVNISYLRVDKPMSAWRPNEVALSKTISFIGSDRRVDLKSGTEVTTSWTTEDHAPELGLGEVGYTAVTFSFIPRIAGDDPTLVSIAIKFGSHADRITLDKSNGGVFLWELYSDKFNDVTELTYDFKVYITTGNRKEPVVTLPGVPDRVQLSSGPFKSSDVLLIEPPVPDDKVALIQDTRATPSATT